MYCLLSLQSFCLVSTLNGASVPLQFDEQMQNLSQYDHIAFTFRNGIHAVMQRLEELQGSTQAELQALRDSKVQCWALGADAQLLRSYGVQSVQTPAKVSWCKACVVIVALSSACRLGSFACLCLQALCVAAV